mmetsp:Transcript_80641/g.142247  ORF Transcript_80641/g.142247 Transcript_80641/m.142247 type:complete len:302 (-) Transcript_80641:739-1644(-)
MTLPGFTGRSSDRSSLTSSTTRPRTTTQIRGPQGSESGLGCHRTPGSSGRRSALKARRWAPTSSSNTFGRRVSSDASGWFAVTCFRRPAKSCRKPSCSASALGSAKARPRSSELTRITRPGLMAVAVTVRCSMRPKTSGSPTMPPGPRQPILTPDFDSSASRPSRMINMESAVSPHDAMTSPSEKATSERGPAMERKNSSGQPFSNGVFSRAGTATSVSHLQRVAAEFSSAASWAEVATCNFTMLSGFAWSMAATTWPGSLAQKAGLPRVAFMTSCPASSRPKQAAAPRTSPGPAYRRTAP